MTIFLDTEEINELKIFAKRSKSETIMTYFYQFQYMNCVKTDYFRSNLKLMSGFYAIATVMLALLLIKPISKKPTIM